VALDLHLSCGSKIVVSGVVNKVNKGGFGLRVKVKVTINESGYEVFARRAAEAEDKAQK